MKERILALRAEGKTYTEIQQIVGCARSTVSYYCGPTVSTSQKAYKQKYRDKHKPHRKYVYRLARRVASFNGGQAGLKIGELKEVLDNTTQCYLTGRPLDVSKDKYHLDHKIPKALGGESTLANLGIACPEANTAKGALLLDDFLLLCTDVLVHHGYKVTN